VPKLTYFLPVSLLLTPLWLFSVDRSAPADSPSPALTAALGEQKPPPPLTTQASTRSTTCLPVNDSGVETFGFTPGAA
jgi:hypothetical protein